MLNDDKRMAEIIRAFIAIELNKEIKAKLDAFQERLKESCADVKWVNPDSIHLTLKFLGNIPPSSVKQVKEILNNVAKKTAPFAIAFSKIGAFPKMDYPRVIWVGMEEGRNNIIELNRNLEDKLEKIGVVKEARPFEPHLTLGRVKSPKNKEELKKIAESLNRSLTTAAKMRVSGITLFKSALSSKGAIYTPLSHATFAS